MAKAKKDDYRNEAFAYTYLAVAVVFMITSFTQEGVTAIFSIIAALGFGFTAWYEWKKPEAPIDESEDQL